jgi:hypothetical protein
VGLIAGMQAMEQNLAAAGSRLSEVQPVARRYADLHTEFCLGNFFGIIHLDD